MRSDTSAFVLSFLMIAFWAIIVVIAVRNALRTAKSKKHLPDFYSIHKISKYNKGSIPKLCTLHIIVPGVKMAILDSKNCDECDKERKKKK